MTKEDPKFAVIKTCRSCSTEKPLEAFVKSKKFASGYDTICTCCNRTKVYNWKKQNRERQNLQEKKEYPRKKNAFLQRMYGISLSEYLELLKKQDNCCAICGICQDDCKRWLSVDHNHATGEVRALLCPHCNSLLGHARESTKILIKAIDYLNEHNI